MPGFKTGLSYLVLETLTMNSDSPHVPGCDGFILCWRRLDMLSLDSFSPCILMRGMIRKENK